MKHLLTIICIAFAANLIAQEKQTLTIEEALAIAMKNNAQVISAQNDYNSASANVLPKTVGKILPTADASMRASRTVMNQSNQIIGGRDTTLNNNANSFSYSLTANYVLFDGFLRIEVWLFRSGLLEIIVLILVLDSINSFEMQCWIAEIDYVCRHRMVLIRVKR